MAVSLAKPPLTDATSDLYNALDALVDWTEALAIAGAVTPDAWVALDKLHERACRALDNAQGRLSHACA